MADAATHSAAFKGESLLSQREILGFAPPEADDSVSFVFLLEREEDKCSLELQG